MSGRRGHFGRFDALAENGWLGVLTGQELALWCAYEKHADADGVAYPKGATLAGMLGHVNTNHVGRLRRALVAYGLLEVIEPGGGSGNACRVRVLMPGQAEGARAGDRAGDRAGKHASGKHSRNGSDCDGSKDSRIGSVRGDKHSQIGRANTPDSGGKTLPIREIAHREEEPNEEPNEEITAANRAPGVRRGPVAVGISVAAVERLEAEAEAILDAAGFPPDDAIRRHPNAELPLLRELAADVEFLRPLGQVANVRAYFAQGIRERWGPNTRRVQAEMAAAASKAVEQRRAALAVAEAAQRSRATEQANDLAARERREREAIEAVPADRLAELVEAVLEANPDRRSFWAKKHPMQSPGLRAEVLKLLTMQQTEVACST
ncbi:helix-turn-helix domain-containing protein [Humisphaera borealis]|uniref:Helix-turn-helix domain-containing protein n=1 Tax=Humisphaera borealis TaxID=2807512 RepID=A0A7M2WQE6_9BACT|nr:hypothetical protein [Humisphaera borealis]QOV87623.1 hypothetical protein IPV69_15150 [Humisphaera borealis]